MKAEFRDQRAEIREQRSGIRERGLRVAFTLPELLVVIAIGILLLAIAVPAFSSVLYSSRKSGAAASVQSALAAARDVALESGPGRDAAAVFFADRGGQMRIMVAVYAGQLLDEPVEGGPPVRREIFVRSPRVEPIALPEGWAVSGRARANMIDREWYERTYPAPGERREENWVYPETALDRPDDRSADDGRMRQTFMVRFAGGSGALTYGGDEAVLVVDPAPTREFRSADPWDAHDVMETADQRRFVQRVITGRDTGLLSAQNSYRLLGDRSSDTVLARPVGQVAVYNMRRLAAAVGARRLNEDTGSLYKPALPPEHDRSFDEELFGGSIPGNLKRSVNAWISNQPVAGVTDSDAQIFTVQRYLGRPLEAVAIGEAPE